MKYPDGHTYESETMDLAFVINGIPRPLIVTGVQETIYPFTINVRSKGRWVSGQIGLPEGYEVNDINIKTVRLEDTIPADWGKVTGKKLLLKFDRSELEDMIMGGPPPIKPAEFKVSGGLVDGTRFMGYTNTITFTGLE